MIYEEYAKTLLNMHHCYHNLILKEFNQVPLVEKRRYENEGHFNWDGILFNKKIDAGKYNIFPHCPIHYSKNGLFSMEYRSYNGKIAKKIPKKLEKHIIDKKKLEWIKYPGGDWKAAQHGLFDFYINVGTRYESLYSDDPTHYNLFIDLLRYSNYEACKRVWVGEDTIETIAKNDDEYEALLILSLMMFEQEVNYGEESFQQYTNFTIREGFRPRDMLMGFIKMSFETPIHQYPYWETVKNSTYKNGWKTSPHFNGSYEALDDKYKRYFEHFRFNVDFKTVKPLLSNSKIKDRFTYYSEKAGDNPHLVSLEHLR